MNFMSAQIYKPERVLYYIQPTQKEKEDFFLGILPESLNKYNGYFGTYDCPGLFRLIKDNETIDVLGIEFRPNDDRISYPTDLKFQTLKPSYMISALNTDDSVLNADKLADTIDELKKSLKSYISRGGIKVKEKAELVQVFTNNKKTRYYIAAELSSKNDFFKTYEPDTEKERQLHTIAYHDSITGHYNWNYIWPIIVGYGEKNIQDFAFAHFDVKDFKSLNIVYGHHVANHVLKKIVQLMNEQDWIYCSARCHNDNFAMMIKDMPEEELRAKLTKFFDELSILEEDPNYHVFFRCGVVPMRNTLLLGDTVADAGKQVQAMGTKPYETEILFYTDQMHEDLDWSSTIKSYLDTAISKDEFLVYLQPKFDIDTNTVHGSEALIRWKYHNKELLSPAKFIPIFEANGLIGKLDDIVLRKVCEYIVSWKKRGLPVFPVSINLSRKRMGNPNLVNHLTSIVDSFNVDHSLIDFELTESAAYNNQAQMISILLELKKRGFKISMDDFGTGYSALSLLTTMPMDTIKIDKSFVDGIGTESKIDKDSILLKNILIMAKELNFTCLAEGAETELQVRKLKDFGCELVQGYYYSKPLPIEDYEKLIQQ